MPPGSARLILPVDLYAVPGVETNVYFSNVFLTTNINNYAIHVDCDRGEHYAERWAWTPTADDAGDYEFSLTVLDEANNVVAAARSTLHVAPVDSGAKRDVSILMIGDSLTHATIYPRRVWTLCQGPGNPKLIMIGTSGTGDVAEKHVRHEGYGGWTAHAFMHAYTGVAREGDYRKRGSPFIYGDEGKQPSPDFARYCREHNNGNAPGIVTIFLGPNDIYPGNRETYAQVVDAMLEHYTALVDMIREHDAATQIGIMLAIPPAATQDAFRTRTDPPQTQWQYRNVQHHLVERMIEQYGNRADERIHLIPTVVNIDCARNYPDQTVAANAANPTRIVRQNNAVHPAEPGYIQIGDTVYAWIKHLLKS